MNQGCSTIATRSKRQAEDWALALTSQEIECTLDRAESFWILVVRNEDVGRALTCLTRYEAENVPRAWSTGVPGTGLLFHWGVLAWSAWMILLFWASNQSGTGWRSWGQMASDAIHQGQWWRLFTAVSLHADLAHLASNLLTGTLVLGLAMARFGGGLALQLAFLGGAAGNVVSLFWHEQIHRGLGASGMVMAGLGILAANSIAWWHQSPVRNRYAVSALAAGCFLFLMWGSAEGSDIAAHTGGFVAGLILGAAASWLEERLGKWINSVSWGLLLISLLGTWWLALRHSR